MVIDGATMPLLTVNQAYAIDIKTDDGLPQSGNVIAMVATSAGGGGQWAAGGPASNAAPPDESNFGDYNSATGGPVQSVGDIGDGMPAGSLSCYDGSMGLPERYSVAISNGANVNCWLSFRFQ